MNTRRPALTRRQLIVLAIAWAATLALGLWLAAHDPHYLSQAVQLAIDGKPT